KAHAADARAGGAGVHGFGEITRLMRTEEDAHPLGNHGDRGHLRRTAGAVDSRRQMRQRGRAEALPAGHARNPSFLPAMVVIHETPAVPAGRFSIQSETDSPFAPSNPACCRSRRRPMETAMLECKVYAANDLRV